MALAFSGHFPFLGISTNFVESFFVVVVVFVVLR